MADATVDWSLGGMNSKYLLQEKILDRFEKDTGRAIVDPNNPAVELIEAFSSTAADIVKSIEETVRPAIYPARATSVVDLYKHLSDYDYKGLFANPASTTVLVVMDKNYTISHSLDVPGTNYRKIVIPKETIITIGEHRFGLYYPIEIRSNMDTGSMTVVYDTTVKNPLMTLASNVLEYEIRRFNEQELIYIKIPVYQFEIQIVEDVLTTGSGYSKTVPYNNQFYAIRCTADVIENRDHDSSEQDRWVNKELHLCVGGQVYDAQEPTLVFTPDISNNTIHLSIPHIYFTKSLIRGNLRIEIYTTEGAIDYTIPEDTTENETLDMFSNLIDEETTYYVLPFKQMPALTVLPLGNRVTGGSDGVSFEDLRRRVITGTVRDKTLQTPDDIDAYFTDQGYVTTTLRDGVTDRVFIAHAPAKTADGEIVGAASVGSLFDFRTDSLKDYNTIVSCGGNRYTILPSTRYKFDSEKGICVPLTVQERTELDALVPTAKVAEFNSKIYTLSPFHLHVDTSSRYPMTVTYDMTDSEVKSQEFMAERQDVTAQLALSAVSLSVVKGSVKDSYKLKITVARSESLSDINAVVADGDQVGKRNMRVIVALKNDDSSVYFTEATYFGRVDDLDVYELIISSDYKFNQANNNHTVKLQVPGKGGRAQESDFFLTTEVRLILCVNGDIEHVNNSDYQYVQTDFTNATNALDDLNNLYALSEYKVMCQFGSPVDEIDQRINLTYSEAAYKKYCTTKFLTFEYPEYKRDANGKLIATVVGEGDNRRVVIDEEYSVGQLVCISKTTGLESKTLNGETVKNYLGCKATNDAEEVIEHITESDVNVKLAIENCPVIPSFTVDTASIESAEAVGEYELVIAKEKRGGKSSPTDKWVKCGARVEGQGYTTCTAENAILYVLTHLVPESNRKERTDNPLFTINNVLAPAGTFMLFSNDEEYDNTIPWIGTPDSSTAGRVTCLYYCYKDSRTTGRVTSCKWMKVAQGQNYSDMLVAANNNPDPEQGINKIYGYLYLFNAKPVSGEPVHVISFLNTTERDGVVIPDFTGFAVAYFDETTHEMIDPNRGWSDKVDKFPWDAKVWQTVDSYTGPEEVYTCTVVDDIFKMCFMSNKLARWCDYTSAQYMLDEKGQLVEDPTQPRAIQYLVDMLQLDAKLAETSANKSNNIYQNSVAMMLRAHFDNLATAKNNLFTNTRLIFEPTKSIGFANFVIGSDTSKELQLDIEIGFKIHVSQTSADDSILMENVRNKIISIIDEKIQIGYLNCTEIATKIMEDISDTVLHVDILGINGDPNIQTLECADTEVRPHLAHRLKTLDDDLTIDVDRALTLEVVVSH